MFASKVRLLGGIFLAVAIGIIASDATDAFAQKTDQKPDQQYNAKKTDATKKVAGTLGAGAKLSAEELAKHIDKLIAKKLLEEKTDTSDVCSDEDFLRRIYLDLVGKIPTAEQAVAFLDSKDNNKRAKLIDELLAKKEFGKYQADLWQSTLLPRDSDNVRFRQFYPKLEAWLEKEFNDNRGWDKTVKDFLTSSGDIEKNGAVIYWLANGTADKMTDNVTRVFMGIQLQCAQCHNHPFTDYKQNEYWHMAAFFMKVGPDGNAKAQAKDGKSITISENSRPKKKLANPDAKILPPKFLRGETPKASDKDALRPFLADWMTSKNNEFFSRAMVNRTWGQLLGRGLVAPVDDMHDANPASHPELLLDLTGQFTNNDFDVKYLFRAICNSTTYQRTSKIKGNNDEAGPEVFSRALVRPLTPGQMWDSLQLIVGRGKGDADVKGKNGRVQPGGRAQFIASYGVEDGADPTEYQAGIPQVLRLMNAQNMNNSSLVSSAMKSAKTDAEAIEKLYLTVLSRRPTSEDLDRIEKHMKKSSDTRDKKLSSVLWVLMQSSEFALNR